MLACLVIACTVPPLACARTIQSVPSYHLRFASDAPGRFHVTALVPARDGELHMPPTGAEPLARGWADFIEGLTAFDARGRPVALTWRGSGRWTLARPLDRVRLEYDVVAKHDDVKWEVSGLFARAYHRDGALMFSGNAAFVTGDRSHPGPAEVRFEMPSGWEVATGYHAVAGRKHNYSARNWDALQANATMVGLLSRRSLRLGKLEIDFAAARPLQPTIEMFSAALGPVVQLYGRELGGRPQGKLAIMTGLGPLGGGETYPNSISLMRTTPPHLNPADGWYLMLAHEVAHLWNGGLILPANPDEAQWLNEGFTNYMARLAAYRTGQLTEAALLERLGTEYDRYRGAAGGISMREAGKAKGANFPLLYFGGMMAALALDIEARTSTGGNREGFFVFMRLMNERHGQTGIPYRYEDAVNLAREVGGDEMPEFFRRYVAGTDVLDIAPYLSRMGIEVSRDGGKTLFRRHPQPSAVQARLLGDWLRRDVIDGPASAPRQ